MMLVPLNVFARAPAARALAVSVAAMFWLRQYMSWVEVGRLVDKLADWVHSHPNSDRMGPTDLRNSQLQCSCYFIHKLNDKDAELERKEQFIATLMHENSKLTREINTYKQETARKEQVIKWKASVARKATREIANLRSLTENKPEVESDAAAVNQCEDSDRKVAINTVL